MRACSLKAQCMLAFSASKDCLAFNLVLAKAVSANWPKEQTPAGRESCGFVHMSWHRADAHCGPCCLKTVWCVEVTRACSHNAALLSGVPEPGSPAVLSMVMEGGVEPLTLQHSLGHHNAICCEQKSRV